MVAELNDRTTVRLAPAYRLQWEEAQQVYVLLYPEGMVTLNASASDILKLCNGQSLRDIVAELRRCYPGASLETDVIEFLKAALDEGWIHLT
ncbi:MAG TPA: pyrroloquinoline quinone biosynthesis peptide chaperone PqqD [Gammaproteobacteria bacterium]|nr:pyrroloquinoline quinone biosynthesis peptide chaperone PqqD [Gammaproteobacteria bacterium]